MSMHECPIDGCIELVPVDKLLCRRHWHAVPRLVQLRVYAAWNRGHPTADHSAACDAAIAAVHGRPPRPVFGVTPPPEPPRGCLNAGGRTLWR
jgi:hypothetical protein